MDFPSFLLTAVNDVSPGRLIETLTAIGFLWWKVGPFLKKYDQRLESLEKVVKAGFESGETRFQKIEDTAKETAASVEELKTRVSVLEEKLAR